MNKLFNFIDFETSSICNRRCPTCIRNSHPYRDKIDPWFKVNYLPMPLIGEALEQCIDLGFSGGVCLSHYNEPLLDGRIIRIAKNVKKYNVFKPIFLHTNGDKLNKVVATGLDGYLDEIHISFYNPNNQEERAEWTSSLFKVTKVINHVHSEHIPTHFSPNFDVIALAEQHRTKKCIEPQMRVILNHRGEYLLCCDDVIGNFDLGTFPEISIKDFWFGKRLELANILDNVRGRLNFEYCKTCPRP